MAGGWERAWKWLLSLPKGRHLLSKSLIVKNSFMLRPGPTGNLPGPWTLKRAPVWLPFSSTMSTRLRGHAHLEPRHSLLGPGILWSDRTKSAFKDYTSLFLGHFFHELTMPLACSFLNLRHRSGTVRDGSVWMDLGHVDQVSALLQGHSWCTVDSAWEVK